MFPVPIAWPHEAPDPATHVQEMVAESSSAGKMSVTGAPTTALGPPLTTVMAYVTLLPAKTVSRPSVFVIERSAEGVVTVALAVSLLMLGSTSFWNVLVAVFVNVPGCVTMALIGSVADWLTPIVPTVHLPVAWSYVPCEGLPPGTNVRPGGSGSLTMTQVAGLGPLLVAVTVKVPVSPTGGAALSTVFAITTSACGFGVMVACPELLIGLMSGSKTAERVAVLVYAATDFTWNRSSRLAEVWAVRVPMFHTPVAELNVVPASGTAPTREFPGRIGSLMIRPVAFAGPLFVAVTVKVTMSPSIGVGLSTVFVTAMSRPTGIVRKTSGEVTVRPPAVALAVAVLVRLPCASTSDALIMKVAVHWVDDGNCPCGSSVVVGHGITPTLLSVTTGLLTETLPTLSTSYRYVTVLPNEYGG